MKTVFIGLVIIGLSGCGWTLGMMDRGLNYVDEMMMGEPPEEFNSKQ